MTFIYLPFLLIQCIFYIHLLIYLLHLSSTFIFYIYLLIYWNLQVTPNIFPNHVLSVFAMIILPISIFIKMDTIVLSIGWFNHYSIYSIPVPVHYSKHYALILIFPSILILLIFEFFQSIAVGRT